MIEFIDPNSNKVVSKWNEMSRKAYYIHGTASKNDRWNPFSSTVQQLNRIAFGIGVDKNDTEGIKYVGSDEFKKVCCDFSFRWGNDFFIDPGNNWFLNSVVDRLKASEKLINHISKNIGKCEEIVLIGHSHRGNVAIQAADKIFSRIPTIKRVFVLTIGTPAYNSLFITSYINNKNLTTFNEELSETIPYIGKDYVVPFMKFRRKLNGILGLYLYVNCENPATWKNKNKISHLALWNKQDYVDNLAWALDRSKYYPYHAMTYISGYFTNSTTENVEFDFDPKETRREFETKFKFFPEWLANLDYLRNCMIDLRMKGYDMPPMPALRTYDEYSSYCEKKEPSEPARRDKYVHEPDAVRVDVPKPKPIIKQYTSTKLRLEINNLQELFISTSKFYQFLTEIDNAKIVKSPNEYDVIDIYQQKYPEIKAIEDIKQEMFRKKEFQEKAMAIYLLDNTSFHEHGFDLSNPTMIEEAINEGRIKPFPRAHVTDKTKE